MTFPVTIEFKKVVTRYSILEQKAVKIVKDLNGQTLFVVLGRIAHGQFMYKETMLQNIFE